MTTQLIRSPMMQQWYELKQKAQDAILLFRLGDFYEGFYDDAKILSDVLDITLTKRQDVPMSGIPYHSSSNYISELLSKGFKVAIAEQVENAKETKGLVKRDIVKIYSPGAFIDQASDSTKKHHFICFMTQIQKKMAFAWLDISLNEMFYQILEPNQDSSHLLQLISPKELLIEDLIYDSFSLQKSSWPDSILYSEKVSVSSLSISDCDLIIKKHFNVLSLTALGLIDESAVLCLGKLVYILKNQRLYSLENVSYIKAFYSKNYLIIDKATQNHLELFEKKEGRHSHLTLFHYLNHTFTSAGSRLFETWLKFPLTNHHDILERQECVVFLKKWEKAKPLTEILKSIKDIQKIITKIHFGTANPQDMKHLELSMKASLKIKSYLEPSFPRLLNNIFSNLLVPEELLDALQSALVEIPNNKLNEGPCFKKGYCPELDNLLDLTESQEDFLRAYETKLRQDTGIKTLKVGSSKNFGFYIEISKGQASSAPSYFVRRQTLTNQERFTTDELNHFEKKAFVAKQEFLALEAKLFEDLCQKVLSQKQDLLETAHNLSLLDALFSLTIQAQKKGYHLPQLSEKNELIITKGRHPILEDLLSYESFIPNDVHLHRNPDCFYMITGPNMGGKSTFMRQTALCVIMAQMGGFVPCESMHFSPVDKLFTRIGASDDLTSGQSTFMVEMAEAAYILKNATAQSLVIIDEIGRGTSTYDGIAIAYAIAKYLTFHKSHCPKTLFATHYFELTNMSQEDPSIVNFHAGVQEHKGQLLFLHQILKGAADKSYGIQVAKLAGLPHEVIHMAQKKLLEFHNQQPEFSFVQNDIPVVEIHPLIHELEKTNLNQLTPLQALNLLHLWKSKYSI